MILKRIMSGTVAAVITAGAIFNSWLFVIVACGLTAGGLYEFFHMVKRKGIPIYSYVGIFIGVMIPLSICFQFELTRNWELLFFVCAFLLMLMLQFAREDSRNAVVGLATTLFGVLYVSWFFSFLVKVKLLLPGWDGAKLLAFIIVVTKSSDFGAMVFGTWLGRHPLLPKVSPNKSIEGCIGGLVTSAFAAVLCQSWLPQLPTFTVGYVALLGAFFGGLGQLGDLSESLIKRDCSVKDSGTILPGMGGILDAIDSLLFSGPAFYLYMSSTLNLFVGR